MLEHVIYSVVRKLIRTRYEVNERAPISVQILKNSHQNSQLSPQLFHDEPRACSLFSHPHSSPWSSTPPKFWLNRACSWPAPFQNSSSPFLNCRCPPGTQGEKHVHLAWLSWLRADVNRTEGACERSQIILLETLVTAYYQISAARQDGERYCSCNPLLYIPVTWFWMFAKRRAVP